MANAELSAGSVSAMASPAARAIAFACDENYAPYLPVALQSLLANAMTAQSYDLIIMDCCADAHSHNFSETIADLRDMLADKKQFSLKIIKIRGDLAHNVFLRQNEQALKRYGYGTYARILIPDALSEYEKVLYLDIDHIILGDIAYFFALDLGDRLIAAVPDINVAYERLLPHSSRRRLVEGRLGLKPDEHYIIASPMLFNIAACRAFHFTEKVLSFLAREHDLPFPDQDAINAVCRGRIFYLPQKWGRANARNFAKLSAIIRKSGGKEQAQTVLGDWQAEGEEPAIIHYVATPKPWKSIETDYSGFWWHYAARTRKSASLLFALLFPSADLRGHGHFIKTYKIMGLPFLTIKTFPQEKQYLLCKIPLIRKKYGKENCYIYILGMKLISVRKKETWEAG